MHSLYLLFSLPEKKKKKSHLDKNPHDSISLQLNW